MSRLTTIGVLAVIVSLASCVSPEAHRQVLSANDVLQKQLADLQRVCDEQQDVVRRITAQNAALGKRAVDAKWLEDQRAKLARLLKELGPRGSDPLPGVKVIQTDEGTALRVRGEVLFASGRADLTQQGRTTLQKLVEHLRGQPIRISGHTDSEPIKRSKWSSNLHLSCGRALTVAEFLIKSGLDGRVVSVAGYGEHRPVAAGNGDEIKAQNRRVEILLLQR